MHIYAAVARAVSHEIPTGERASEYQIGIESCELDGPQADEVLVQLEACGICHTDLLAASGHLGTPLPAVLGHEGVGRVLQLGEGVSDVNIGDRVLMSFGACGTCPSCARQAPAYCHRSLQLNFRGQRLDCSSPLSQENQAITGHFFAQSAFATHAIARVTNLVRLEDDLPAYLMAPMACGVQTGVSAVMNVLNPGKGDRIAIFGCGTVGLAAVMAAKIAGCEKIIAVDLNPNRVKKAKTLGAGEGIVSADLDEIKKAIRKLGGIHCGFDSTGHPGVIELGFKLLLPQGSLLCAGVSPVGTAVNIDLRDLVFSGRRLLGTVEGDANPRDFIPRMIEWFRRGELPLEELVDVYDFQEINQAMQDLREGRSIKPVLKMQN